MSAFDVEATQRNALTIGVCPRPRLPQELIFPKKEYLIQACFRGSLLPEGAGGPTFGTPGSSGAEPMARHIMNTENTFRMMPVIVKLQRRKSRQSIIQGDKTGNPHCAYAH